MAGYGDLFVGGLKPTVGTALVAGIQLAAQSGSLTWLTTHNYNASARMLLLLDALPANSPNPLNYVNQAVLPVWFFPIAAAASGLPGTLPVDWTVPPLQFRNGMWAVLSTILTTPYLCTTTTTADGAFSAGVNLA